MWISRQEGWIERVDVPEEGRGMPSLSDSLLKELARQSLLIERHFGSPQDIEWAIDGDGNIFILQSRPIHVPSEGGSNERLKRGITGFCAKTEGLLFRRDSSWEGLCSQTSGRSG